MKDHKYGTDPVTGRALNKDGSVRKKRVKLTAAQKAAKARETVINAAKSLGRDAIKEVKSLALFVASIGTFRKWGKDAVSFSTPEKRAEKRAYYERMLDTIDAKGAAAEAWLPSADAALADLASFEANVGEAIMEHLEANDNVPPTAEEAEAIVRSFLTDEVRELVEGAADPSNDPFAEFRRNAVADDDGDDDEDTLDSDE